MGSRLIVQNPIGVKNDQTSEMDHSQQLRSVTPSSPSSSMPRQNKVVQQRQYREKEGECFNMLRDVIHKLTGEELQTRHDILRKGMWIVCHS